MYIYRYIICKTLVIDVYTIHIYAMVTVSIQSYIYIHLHSIPPKTKHWNYTLLDTSTIYNDLESTPLRLVIVLVLPCPKHLYILLVKIEASVWHTIYHQPTCCFSGLSSPSVHQPTILNLGHLWNHQS